jgi:hypothetical protein
MSKFCLSCQNMVDESERVCSFCGHSFSSDNRITLSRIVPAPKPKVSANVEIYTLDDYTQSSDRFAAGIPLTFDLIIRDVVLKARSVTCSLQLHGDLDEEQPITLVADRVSPAECLDELRMVRYDGGGDPPEHHLDAVLHAMRTGGYSFMPGTRRVMLLFCTADSKPSREGKSPEEIGEMLKSRGVLLYAICESAPRINAFIEAAKGYHEPISNSPDTERLRQIAKSISASIIKTVASGATVPLIPQMAVNA